MSFPYLLVVFGLGTLVVPPARCQDTTRLTVGRRVRITALVTPRSDVRSRPGADEQLMGAFTEVRSDSVYLTVDNTTASRAVPLARVRRVEVSNGVASHGAAGAGIGLLTGAAVAAAIADATLEPKTPGQFRFYEKTQQGAYAVALGAVGGVVVGALIGARTHTERWTPASLDLARSRLSILPLLRPECGIVARLGI